MSSQFNLYVLRRLFNKDNKGKGVKGQSHRTYIHTTITAIAYQGLAKVVPLGPGGYAAPVLDISLRLMLYLIGALSQESIVEMLSLAINDRSALASRLRSLADQVDQFSGSSETEIKPE